nr:MAG TPA: hypothetical protein [Caudoviricetes sp.]
MYLLYIIIKTKKNSKLQKPSYNWSFQKWPYIGLYRIYYIWVYNLSYL